MTPFAALPSFTLHYMRKGSGFPILFIHGFSEDLRFWQPQMEEFSKKFQVISFDLRGFGQSDDQPDHDFTYFDDIKALLDYLHIDKTHVVGHSLGGSVGINFAIKYPEMVQSLTVSASVLGGYTWEDRSVIDTVWEVGKTDIDSAKKIWLEALFNHVRKIPRYKELIEIIIADYSGWHWQHKDRSKSLKPPARSQLEHITVPTKIFVGRLDLVDNLKIAEILHEEIKHAEIDYFDDVGHIINLEAKDRFNKLLMEFLDRNTPQ